MATPKRNISQRSELINDVHEFGLLPDTREIFLNSDPSCEYDKAMIDHWSATNFIKNIQVLNSISNKRILVHMCTVGGDWSFGMAIYDSIKFSPSPVTILAYGYASSMSSVVPQAAQWRVMMPNSHLLIHDGSVSVSPGWRSAVSEIEWAKREREMMLDIYVERCKEGQYWKREGMDEKAIKLWIGDQMDRKQEFYMTPKEAVDKGFMDAILGDEDFEDIETLRNEE